MTILFGVLLAYGAVASVTASCLYVFELAPEPFREASFREHVESVFLSSVVGACWPAILAISIWVSID